MFTLCALLLLPLAAAGEARFAVVAGRNDGAADRVKLRFAETDARRFAGTLTELGGFPAENVNLLESPSRDRLLTAIKVMELRVREALEKGAPRALLVIYYSGHADTDGLELGDERVSFPELRALLDKSRAQVRVAFVDACKSGALTKGATAVKTEFELTVAAEPSPDGTAIVASSAPGEDALESAELRGSFFTHHLLAGLRGAADRDLDSKVTLLEAYRYAYGRTVAETARVTGVPQHPTYELKLRGKGDLVLAELARAEAYVSFDPGPAHRWLVVGEARGDVWEVRTAPDSGQVLGLRAGRYRIVRADERDVVSGHVDLARGARISAARVPLSGEPYAMVIRRGLWDRDPHALIVQGALGTGVMKNFGASTTLLLGTRHDLTSRLSLLPRVFWGQKAIDDDGLRYDFTMLGAQSVLGVRIPLSGFEAFAGPLVGVSSTRQTLITGATRSALALQTGLSAGLQMPLSESLFAHVSWEAVGHTFRLNEDLALRTTLGATVGLEYSVSP